jgi:hypothetical protein
MMKPHISGSTMGIIMRLPILSVLLLVPAIAAAQEFQPSEFLTKEQVASPMLVSEARAFVDYVRGHGYRCQRPDLVRRCVLSACFVVSCDLRWTYTIRQTPQGGLSIQAE